ncbi:MAG TPA: cytochrome ubiquinol oxidase subunit I [Vicinamibacterales bacterium]|jgi:cytochrome d ubiquinol oxidase subunit I
MALSLGFHIVFAEIGIAMPLLMVLAEWRGRRTGDAVYLQLARRWAKGTAVLFAVGAVSGTVLSFELGLLWPAFMRLAGPVIGIPFSLEGFAFFTEAIFLGVYLYGWERVSPRAHLLAGLIVAASGAASALFVVIVNAWMNTPTGITIVGERVAGIDPIAGMLNPSSLQQVVHMLLAAYASTGLAVAGIHAAVLLRRRDAVFHRHAMMLALTIGIPAALLQPISGDLSARTVARWQPVKLAAMEALLETQRGAPLHMGGVIEVPRGLSLLAFHDPDAEVRGLNAFPRSDRPPVAPVQVAFQLMVMLGTLMALVCAWAAIVIARGQSIAGRSRLLAALAALTPAGFIATEAGWTVTEVGRQPWVIGGILRTADAVTPMPGLAVPMVLFALVYIGLAAVVATVIASFVRETA